MKSSDMSILCMLRKNSRMSLTEMSRKTGIPVSTIFDRLRSFQGSVITKNSALVDFSRLGFVVKSFVIFSVDRSQKEEFSSFLLAHHDVNSLYRVNNGYDIITEVLHRDINCLEKFLDSLQARFKVKEKKVFFVMEELKKEAFFSDEHLLP